jgi:hypothetical protein
MPDLPWLDGLCQSYRWSAVFNPHFCTDLDLVIHLLCFTPTDICI